MLQRTMNYLTGLDWKTMTDEEERRLGIKYTRREVLVGRMILLSLLLAMALFFNREYLVYSMMLAMGGLQFGYIICMKSRNRRIKELLSSPNPDLMVNN